MTTPRAPYKTRRWTPQEDEALRALVAAGRDARVSGKDLQRSFLGVQASVKKLKLTLVSEERRNSSPENLWRWAVSVSSTAPLTPLVILFRPA